MSIEQLRPDTWSLRVPIPHEHTPYTQTYLIRDVTGSVHLIDPGWASEANRQLVTAAVAEVGDGLASIVVTHLHPDHVGLAEELREQTGARVVMHSAEAGAMLQIAADDHSVEASDARLAGWGVPVDRRAEVITLWSGLDPQPAVVPDVLVADGERLKIPGRDIRVLHTPGHTVGHICLRDDDHGLLFTGDHLLPTTFPGVGLGGTSEANPLADYRTSLERLELFDEDEACPGHGDPFRGITARVQATLAHHARRTAEVAAHLERHPDAAVWDVAAGLTWTAGWENFSGFYLASALAQTAMHAELVRACARG